MTLHHLTNSEMQKYYQSKPNFNGLDSINYLPKIKDGALIISLDEHKSIGILDSSVCEW